MADLLVPIRQALSPLTLVITLERIGLLEEEGESVLLSDSGIKRHSMARRHGSFDATTFFSL